MTTKPPPPNPNQTGKPPGVAPTPEPAPKKPKKQRLKAIEPTRASTLAPGTHWMTREGLPVHQTVEDFCASVWQCLASARARRFVRFYRRGGVVGKLDAVNARFEPMLDQEMRLLIERFVVLEEWPRPVGGADPECKRFVCTVELARAVLAHPISHDASSAPLVHELRAVASHPLITPAGLIYDKPHIFDDGSAIWVPKINADVDPIDFWSVVSDFPIVENSKGNLLALVYTVLFRPLLHDNAPLFPIISSIERSGKTKLFQQVLGGILLGRAATVMQWPTRDDEIDKVIGSMLMQGEELGCIDNVPERLDSAALASVITSMRHGTRKLGESKFVHMDNTLTLVATGNHTRCSAEIAKRSCVTILQPGCDNPELRTGFKHSRIFEYVIQNREAILKGLLDGVRAWVAAGCPRTKQVLGGFETWMETVGSLCEFLGYPVLQNRDEVLGDMDNDQGDLEKLVDFWAQIHGSEWVGMAALLPLARSESINVWPYLLERPQTDRAKCIALAQKLRTFVGRTVNGYRIERRGSGSERFYRVAPVVAG